MGGFFKTLVYAAFIIILGILIGVSGVVYPRMDYWISGFLWFIWSLVAFYFFAKGIDNAARKNLSPEEYKLHKRKYRLQGSIVTAAITGVFLFFILSLGLHIEEGVVSPMTWILIGIFVASLIVAIISLKKP